MNNNLFNSSINKNSNINNNCEKNKKITFSQKKSNTIKSLTDVEYFLRDFHKFKNYIKLYKILK